MRKFKKGQKVYWIDPARETSGEYTLCQPIEIDEENEDSVILIGNENSETEVLFHELIFINEALPDKLQDEFQKYVQKNGVEPNLAECQITWLDDGNSCEVNIQLSVDSNPEMDDWIFFYCNGLNDLKALTAPGSDGENFIVTDFYHFE